MTVIQDMTWLSGNRAKVLTWLFDMKSTDSRIAICILQNCVEQLTFHNNKSNHHFMETDWSFKHIRQYR